MKKSFLTIIAVLAFMTTTSIFAEEAKFIRDYNYGARFYENAEYLNGNYRSNFVSIPQNRMLNYKDGFERKIGVFELEGNTLFVGYSEDGSGALQLCDENGKMWISKESYREREESYFKYQGGGSGGVITQIELKGKKYTLVIAGISSNKAGIYSDYDGFRMWVENEAPKDSAASKTIDKAVCYDAADICEGIFKPGYTRLWGEVIERPENAGFIYKYSYKGTDFIFNGNSNDGSKWLQNTDGSLIPLNIVSVFYMYTEANGKPSGRLGVGVEADIQLGNNKVRIVFSQYDGAKRVWVKDTSNYPVIQNEKSSKANSKTKAKKTEKTKKSGKSAAFTRDYENYRRIYSDSDISKGIYKSNYKNIPQNGSEDVSFTVNMKEKGEVELSCKTGIFDIDNYKISIFYNPEKGWQIIPKSENIKSLSYTTNNRFDLSSASEKNRIGMQAEVEVSINKNKYDLTFVCLNAGKGDYRAFIKTGPNEETALFENDNFGIEYYDMVDIRAGVYKPGFEPVNRYLFKDDSNKALFENVTEDEPVYIFDWNGNRFLIGATQDPANYVKKLDGSVIYNPEIQIRCKTIGNDGSFHCYPWLTYGWEGKVHLGDKDVTLAYFKWGAGVFVFVKE
ncbi:hypothetical protein [Treponema bryantii]|uniref:hypothetical protein n=1 Tax=Treponema bryantii TaxID=163 RepID=UPI0003B7382E|nr:hypothetical protein [Treponema bryantii]